MHGAAGRSRQTSSGRDSRAPTERSGTFTRYFDNRRRLQRSGRPWRRRLSPDLVISSRWISDITAGAGHRRRAISVTRERAGQRDSGCDHQAVFWRTRRRKAGARPRQERSMRAKPGSDFDLRSSRIRRPSSAITVPSFDASSTSLTSAGSSYAKNVFSDAASLTHLYKIAELKSDSAVVAPSIASRLNRATARRASHDKRFEVHMRI